MYHNARLRCCIILCVTLVTVLPPLWPQAVLPEGQYGEPLSFVGMRLDELFRRLGPPQSVYAARGEERWQDDVVFTYSEGDFYIYRDRVWQIGLKSAYGLRVRDARTVALLVLGNNAHDQGDYMLYSFSGGAWPISLRVNFSEGVISAIFVYRPDF